MKYQLDWIAQGRKWVDLGITPPLNVTSLQIIFETREDKSCHNFE